MDSRDELRAAFLSARELASPVVPQSEKVIWNGKAIEVRRLSLGEADRIKKLCTNKKGELDELSLLLRSIIGACYVPGSDVRVFEAADLEILKSMTARGSPLEGIISAMAKLNADEATIEENFEQAQTDKSL